MHIFWFSPFYVNRWNNFFKMHAHNDCRNYMQMFVCVLCLLVKSMQTARELLFPCVASTWACMHVYACIHTHACMHMYVYEAKDVYTCFFLHTHHTLRVMNFPAHSTQQYVCTHTHTCICWYSWYMYVACMYTHKHLWCLHMCTHACMVLNTTMRIRNMKGAINQSKTNSRAHNTHAFTMYTYKKCDTQTYIHIYTCDTETRACILYIFVNICMYVRSANAMWWL